MDDLRIFWNDAVAQRSPKSCNRISGYDLRQRKLNLGSADIFDNTTALHTNSMTSPPPPHPFTAKLEDEFSHSVLTYRKVQRPQQDPDVLYYLYIPMFEHYACFRENIISTVIIRHLICLLFPLSWRGHRLCYTMGEQHILALFMSLVP